ncbi:glycosyltransferase [Candidatus Sumerlaeota bacterium]|nr:glycosyltransferase [Candidatus Sumerlaeota bacterium]
METTALVILGFHAFLWFVRWEKLFNRRKAQTPVLLPLHKSSSNPASVTVFVPARNEEHAIGAALKSLLAQDHRQLHIVVINDRSTDRTREILAQFSDPRLTVVTAPEPPMGWMGKCHALHCGVKAAAVKTEYYLFTDADVIFAPTTIRRTVSHIVREHGDLLALFPRVDCVGFWENAMLPMLSHLGYIMLDPRRIADPDTKDFVGIGAFCLIRRDMYERWGGHAAIRNEVIDDMAMGLKTKQQRGRILVVRDPRAIHLRWYRDLKSIVNGFEKNMHQAVGKGLVGAIASTIFFPAAHVIPILVAMLVLATKPDAWYLWIPALLLYLGTGSRLAHRMRHALSIKRWLVVLAYPAGALLASYTMLRSAYFSEIKREIRWRGRSMPRGRQETRIVR